MTASARTEPCYFCGTPVDRCPDPATNECCCLPCFNAQEALKQDVTP